MEIPKLVMNRKLQFFMLMCMVLPQVYCWTQLSNEPTPYQQVSRWMGSFKHWRTWMQDPLFWTNFFAMAVERLCYTIVWVRSRWFMKLCKNTFLREWGTPVDVVGSISIIAGTALLIYLLLLLLLLLKSGRAAVFLQQALPVRRPILLVLLQRAMVLGGKCDPVPMDHRPAALHLRTGSE
mmetsp:Transcript_43123/g.69473  ORF Transcript_43123/g.69473 Transcript_43123/m.69473 type:complete len:180 (+) Transcript_43123:2046-2585(+)